MSFSDYFFKKKTKGQVVLVCTNTSRKSGPFPLGYQKSAPASIALHFTYDKVLFREIKIVNIDLTLSAVLQKPIQTNI